ncbi:unnamed protein product [Cylicocyclus nassatus]|uniref:Uncharacterized protein n=1 Tax=Cylicocyclus nassatus TaxID=53992 RepID=A0AA36HDY0_CYLNA|nr:unnamed protein product [Cylicocyclus nassatus]
MSYVRDGPLYNENPTTNPMLYETKTETTTVHGPKVQVIEVEPIDCNPGMCAHPMALLRWFQLAMYFLLQWLVQITCGDDACTMIMNVFGYTAMGQLFVLLILLLMSIIVVIILVAYGLNIHRTSYASIILLIERVYAMIGIVLFIVATALGIWMAVLTKDPDVNYQGRGHFHIRGQWIAAAVFEFLMIFLFIADFMLQKRENYPFTGKQDKSQAFRTDVLGPQLETYGAPPLTTAKTTREEIYNQQSRI